MSRNAEWHRVNLSVVSNKTVEKKSAKLTVDQYRNTIKVKFRDTRINEK